MVAIPPETEQRIAARLNRVTKELFQALDDVREHGGNYLAADLTRPGGTEKVHLVLVDTSVRIEAG